MFLATTAQDAGVAEIVVTNPDGQVERLAGAYEYALPQSFDFNGNWEGVALAHPDARPSSVQRHSDMEMRVAIGANLVTSVTCDGIAVTNAAPLVVSQGAFSRSNDVGVVIISGRILSDGHAMGTINTTACPCTRWVAAKKS